MTRDEAFQYLVTKYPRLAGQVGLPEEDWPGAYSLVIDDALRALAFTEAELVDGETEDTDTPGYLALLRYYAVKLFLEEAAARIDTSQGGVSTSRSQLFRNLNALLAGYYAEIVGLGLVVQQGSSTVTRVQVLPAW